jgi:hypothetical protein
MPKPPAIEQCSTCKWAVGPLTPPDRNAGQYQCRRFPPTGAHPEWNGYFPLCVPTQWCGEFSKS